MKIGIFTDQSKGYSSVRLRDVARERGHTVRLYSTSSFAIDIQSSKPGLLYKGKPVQKLDALIPRVGAEDSKNRVSIVRQFEQMGIFCLNASTAITVARDKLRSLQILSRHHIEIPHSAFVFNRSDIEPALERVGGAPVIIKVLHGSQGAGVMLAENTGVASAIIEALQVAICNGMLQKFVSESSGKDIRAFGVGDKVVASMRRLAKDGEFRSNVHKGGSTEAVTLDPEYERTAILAAHIMGLRVAGVDLLEGADGPQVMEVNASPGLEGIEGATGIDVAGAIIDYLEDQIQFPDLDLRERLSLGRGYRITEIPVLRKSEFAGKTIGESDILEQEVQILSITRGGVTIPTPNSKEQLHPGDTLLCFGKELSLKGLLPPPKKRKRKTLSVKEQEAAVSADLEASPVDSVS